jgi:hypothetical protein
LLVAIATIAEVTSQLVLSAKFRSFELATRPMLALLLAASLVAATHFYKSVPREATPRVVAWLSGAAIASLLLVAGGLSAIGALVVLLAPYGALLLATLFATLASLAYARAIPRQGRSVLLAVVGASSAYAVLLWLFASVGTALVLRASDA